MIKKPITINLSTGLEADRSTTCTGSKPVQQ